jgi:hypothetical protein
MNEGSDADQPLRTVFETRELVVHDPKHQSALVHMTCVPSDIPLPQKLDDYSVRNMCDYRMAYSDTIQSNKKLETLMNDKGDFEKTLECMLEERNAYDINREAYIHEKIIL